MKIYYDKIGFIAPKGIKLNDFIEVDELPEVDTSKGEYLFVKDGKLIIEVCESVIINKKLEEAKFLLDSTQYKFGDDYDLKNTDEWLELKNKRQEAREFIRINKNEFDCFQQTI